MVSFHACENRYTAVENSQELLDEVVQKLNDRFKKSHCSIHPEVNWHIGVDLLKDGKFKFHNTTYVCNQGRCTFGIDLVQNEIMPFLTL